MENLKKIKFNEGIPKYISIYNSIKNLIDKKIINDKEKLPPIRLLAKELNVNNDTIINAYNKLKSEGYAYQKMGSGTYARRKEVTSSFRKRYTAMLKKLSTESLEDIIDFTGETNSEVLFPINDLKETINAVLERDGTEALVAKNRCGYNKLIETINSVFWNNELNEENILIVSGAQQGIDIAAKSIININDTVIVEKPTYMGALSAFKWRKANIIEIPIKRNGIDLDKFEKILQKNHIKCFYTMSYFQNPTGITYNIESKKRILELAQIYDFYIIEDDYLSELIYTNDVDYVPFKYLDKNNRVIYIKSFSKIFLPGIRMGYMAVPEVYKEIIEASKLNTDITTSSLMQRALDEYIATGKWKINIKNLNEEYSERYILMKEILNNDFKDTLEYIDPHGGLNFYINIKNNKFTSNELFEELIKNNVYITPAQIFFISPDDGKYSFRIGFYQTNKKKIFQGMSVLKETIEQLINKKE